MKFCVRCEGYKGLEVCLSCSETYCVFCNGFASLKELGCDHLETVVELDLEVFLKEGRRMGWGD